MMDDESSATASTMLKVTINAVANDTVVPPMAADWIVRKYGEAAWFGIPLPDAFGMKGKTTSRTCRTRVVRELQSEHLCLCMEALRSEDDHATTGDLAKRLHKFRGHPWPIWWQNRKCPERGNVTELERRMFALLRIEITTGVRLPQHQKSISRLLNSGHESE
jgi:hypothetical protein